MTHEMAKALYLKRIKQNKNGEEDLNQYFDNRFGSELRDCNKIELGIRQRIDMFRRDDEPKLIFYLVTLEEKTENIDYSSIEGDFGTFYTKEVSSPLEIETGASSEKDEYICSITPIDLKAIKKINRYLYAIIIQHYHELMETPLWSLYNFYIFLIKNVVFILIFKYFML